MLRSLHLTCLLVRYCRSVLFPFIAPFYQLSKSQVVAEWVLGRAGPKQIGLARLITDHVTIAYLTDVYVLEEYQGKGLGTWLLEAVDEVLRSWKGLRRVALMSNGNEEWYERGLGVKVFDQKNESELVFMTRKGEGSVLKY